MGANQPHSTQMLSRHTLFPLMIAPVILSLGTAAEARTAAMKAAAKQITRIGDGGASVT